MNSANIPQALEKALIEWRTRQTRQRKSVSLNEFAAYLGYSRPIVSQWINRDKSPSRGTVELLIPKLVELLGNEAYEILELPIPNPDFQRLSRIWSLIPEEKQHELADQGERFVTENDTAKKSTRPVHKTR
jgi:transcriptional regulator with XRE-family HTH domain